MIENHTHCVLQIFKFFGINSFDLLISNLAFFDKREQHIGSKILDTQIQLFGYLALFKTLIDTSNMLSQGTIVVILNTIV